MGFCQCPEMGRKRVKKWVLGHFHPLLHQKAHFFPTFGPIWGHWQKPILIPLQLEITCSPKRALRQPWASIIQPLVSIWVRKLFPSMHDPTGSHLTGSQAQWHVVHIWLGLQPRWCRPGSCTLQSRRECRAEVILLHKSCILESDCISSCSNIQHRVPIIWHILKDGMGMCRMQLTCASRCSVCIVHSNGYQPDAQPGTRRGKLCGGWELLGSRWSPKSLFGIHAWSSLWAKSKNRH